MDPALLADLLVVLHLAIVGFALFGELAVVVGGFLRWEWVREPVFRLTHVGLVVFVAVEGALGVLCPLTVWESELRRSAGGDVRDASFVARVLREVLYTDVPQPVLDASYIAFAILVLATLVLVPPRRRRSARPRGSAEIGGGERARPRSGR